MRRRRLLASALLAPCALAAPRVARAAGPRRIKIGHNNTLGSVIHTTAEAFAAAVAEGTGGRVTVEIFPNSALGSEAQMLAAVADGSLDMTIAPVGVTSALDREAGLLETPYLFRDAAHARARLDGELGRHCAGLLAAKEVRVLAWGEVGVRHFTANKPITTPADLRGLRLRVPLSPPIVESFRAMGAAADGLPFPQLPEALRTGVFEAQENPINIIVTSNMQRFQSHLSLTGHIYTPTIVAISGDAWEELDAGDRTVFAAAAQRGAVAGRAQSDSSEAEGVAILRAAGMTVVTAIDRAAFQAALPAAIARLGAVYGPEAVARIQRLAA